MFAVAADQAASRRSASIIGVHMADMIINVVTVTAPGRYAALAVARAVVSDALKLQAPSPIQLGSDARCRGAAHGTLSAWAGCGRPCRWSGSCVGGSGRRRSAAGLSPDSGDAVSPAGA
jgi:hypothetical protein